MPHYALLRVNGIESDHIHEIAAPFMPKVFPGQQQKQPATEQRSSTRPAAAAGQMVTP